MLLVREACDCAAKVVTGAFSIQGEKNAPILARVNIGTPSIIAGRTVVWGSNDHIGEPVSIYVSDSFNVAAEIVVPVFGFQGTNNAAVPTGIDVDVAAAWGACHYIWDTVAIRISGRFESGAELIVFVPIGRPKELACFGGISIDTARILATRFVGGSRGHEV